MNKNPMNIANCIHCGKCTKNCSFLTKYEIDISNTEKLKELAYHCTTFPKEDRKTMPRKVEDGPMS